MSEIQVDVNSKVQMEVVVEEEKFTFFFPFGAHVDKSLEACSRFHLGLLKLKERQNEKKEKEKEDDNSNEEKSAV